MNDTIHNALSDLKGTYGQFVDEIHGLEMACDDRGTKKFFFGPELVSGHMVSATKQLAWIGPKVDEATANLKLAFARVRNDEVSASILENRMAYHQRLQAQHDFYVMVLEVAGQAYKDMTGNRWTMPEWATPKKPTAAAKKKSKAETTATAAEAAAYMESLGIDPEQGIDDLDAEPLQTDGTSTSDDEGLELVAASK